MRLIIAQELGIYISTSYIEKILAEKYSHEKKKVNEESSHQTAEIPQIDDRTPIEVSSTGESIIGSKYDDPDDTNSYPHGLNIMNTSPNYSNNRPSYLIDSTMRIEIHLFIKKSCFQKD